MENQSDHDLLIRLDEKMDTILQRLEKGDACMEEHEKRIGKLESFQATLIGISTTISVAITAFGTWILAHFKVT